MMDYSLLIVIEKLQKNNDLGINKDSALYQSQSQSHMRHTFNQRPNCGNWLSVHTEESAYTNDQNFSFQYHFGVIDYLQVWDFNKKMEHFLKGIFGWFDTKNK